MSAAKRILVLNSYSLTGQPPGESVRICSFLEGLERGGYRPGRDVEVDIVDSNNLSELEEQTREAVQRPIDLIHAVGTPNAIVATRCGGGVPSRMAAAISPVVVPASRKQPATAATAPMRVASVLLFQSNGIPRAIAEPVSIAGAPSRYTLSL